jgi:Domain of unknown function (DUF4407)
MSWDAFHSESERFAGAAEVAAKQGDSDRAVELYRLAAEAEARALNEVDPKKSRTLGVTAVSAAALYYKAGESESAKEIALRWLDDDAFPSFAGEQLRDILQQIDGSQADEPDSLKSNGKQPSVDKIPASEEPKPVPSRVAVQETVSILNRFLWFCGGGVSSILSRPECATERGKYTGLGITTLSSTVLAMLSAGYVAMLVFRTINVAVILALLWGLIIFNINRYFYGISRGDQSIRRRLGLILPRLLLTILISFIIAKPITLRLFENEVRGQVVRNQIEENEKMYVITSSKYDDEIRRLAAENESAKRELDSLERRQEQLQTQLLAEATGRTQGSRTGKVGEGPVYNLLKSQLAQVTTELEEQRRRVNSVVEADNRRIDELRQKRSADVEASMASYSPGLLAHLQALGQLSQSNRTVAIADWSVTLLFIFLGASPILMQLLMEPGPYGYILKRIEREVMLREQREMLNLDVQAYIDSEVDREIKMMILGTTLYGDEVFDIASIRAEYTPKIASQVNRRLREQLKGLEGLKEVTSSTKEEVTSTDKPS